ncbi:hypothetical protein AB0I84_07615 [Streptomyces spectabilis]|uniref:hypothetical protein n=1 Tax=Streptomyces spectabilis TaxID=68270 RepID=UPI003403E3D3
MTTATRSPRNYRLSVDLADALAARYPTMGAVERSKLSGVALLVQFGRSVTAASVRRLAAELSGRGQIPVVVTRPGRDGRELVKVMDADTLHAYAVECAQSGRLMRLERSVRRAA